MTEITGRASSPGGLDSPGKQADRQQAAKRSQAVDAIRGLLVILMVIYHAAYMTVLSGLAHFGLYEGFWWIFPRTIAAGFIAVSGWSLARKGVRTSGFKAFLVRAGRLALPALAITVISALLFRKGFVFFGILHLLAASSILAWPFLGRPALAVLTGLAVMGAGLLLGGQRFHWPYLAWLGFRPADLYPVDYLPLLPWFAWCLFGVAAGDLMSRHNHTFDPGTPWQAAILKPLSYLGRHSLGIYLVHLPVLYGLSSLLALLTQG